MKLSLIAVALALTSCTSSFATVDPRVAVSPTFTQSERDAIDRALNKWNTIVRNPFRLDSTGPWQMVKELRPEDRAKGYIGLTDYPGKTIWISPGLSEDNFYATVLHELGHAQGLHHVQGRAVMNPTVGETDFTEADIEECQRIGACGLSEIDAAKLRLLGVTP